MAAPLQGDTGNVEGGNKNIFGATGDVSSRSRESTIVSKTKALAFPDGAVLSLENFEHYGDKPAGSEQQISDMVGLTGKVLQESYRSGLSQSATYHDKVTDR
jgi:hypothetical protein